MKHAALGTCKPRRDEHLETVKSSALVSLLQLHEAMADQSESLQEEVGCQFVIGANLMTATSLYKSTTSTA